MCQLSPFPHHYQGTYCTAVCIPTCGTKSEYPVPGHYPPICSYPVDNQPVIAPSVAPSHPVTTSETLDKHQIVKLLNEWIGELRTDFLSTLSTDRLINECLDTSSDLYQVCVSLINGPEGTKFWRFWIIYPNLAQQVHEIGGPAWTKLFRDILKYSPQVAAKLAESILKANKDKGMFREFFNNIFDALVECNALKELTGICLEVLNEDKPDYGEYQTKLLDVILRNVRVFFFCANSEIRYRK